MTCIPLGRDPQFRPMEGNEPAHRRNGRRFILQVANVLPVKNTLTLVRAFGRLADKHADLDLVICGSRDHRYARDVEAHVRGTGLDRRVQLRGFVEKSELIDLYRRAELFVMPSLHEGFPLSALEAMACGAPCVTSDRGGLPELCGDAGLCYRPVADDRALAEAIDRVLCDEGLRRQMAERSLQQAEQFTWERTARETLAVYDHVG
jgi:glycosyltransferase involved in cell wall biosynthesis